MYPYSPEEEVRKPNENEWAVPPQRDREIRAQFFPLQHPSLLSLDRIALHGALGPAT